MRSNISFGHWLRQERLARDLTQDELAELTACSVSTIRKMELDLRRPSKHMAEQLARQFQLPDSEYDTFMQWVRARDGEHDGSDDTPAVASPRATRRTNLPTPPTSFIGREREVAAVQALLARPTVRLLTLTGPPGIGKTRLALQAASTIQPDFPDGVWFVPLAPLSDPALVVPAIAATLGVKDATGAALFAGLKSDLDGCRLLLVLDNFEQVLGAASAISALLLAAEGFKVLVTSRAALHVYGEQQFRVPGLGLPDPQHLPSLEDLSQYPAVRLFLERAQAVLPDFTLTNKDAALVAAICARLDGLPLTIELAAARLRLFPPQALLARLQSRLTLLTGGARDLPPRQQTLRGAIAWSYDLLEPVDQRLFQRLAVFAGGCTLEACEAVCNAADDPGPGLIDAIESLVAKSLLQQEERGAGEPRLTMLETIREYAVEMLDQSGEGPALRWCHAAYYLQLAEQAAPALTGLQQPVWLARIEHERDNLRAALAWLLENREGDKALRLSSALWRFWETHGPVSEGRRALEAALAQGRQAAPAVRAKALYAAGRLAFAEDAYAAATALHDESLELARTLGDQAAIAGALDSLGNIAQRQGDFGTAQAHYAESLALREHIGDWRGVVISRINLGAVAAAQARDADAQASYEKALALARQLGEQWGIALSLNHLGEAALQQGDYVRAAPLLEESLRLFRRLGDQRSSAWALGNLGMLARKQTDYGRGQPFYKESLALFQKLGARHGVAVCLEGLAAVAAGAGQLPRAARLRGAAEAIRGSIGAPPPPDPQAGAERRRSTGRVPLDRAATSAAWAEGRAMTIEQAVAYALEDAEHPEARVSA